jgi:alkylation response protein AidB-like acyl-CoA dehydrogenase
MDLELSEEQITLRDNFRAVLADVCGPPAVRKIYEAGDDGEAVWKQMVELGWPALAVPEPAGGLGYGFVELGLLAEELGRAAAPATLLATATQLTPALIAAGAEETLAAVAEGRLKGSLALAENGRWTNHDVRTQASRQGDDWLIQGSKQAVLAGSTADIFAVVARDASTGEPGLFLVEADRTRRATTHSIDPGLLLADVSFEATPARALILPGEQARVALAGIAEEAAVAMALQGVGACRRIFEMTLEYAKIRKQYDRVIGSFQALKHRFADLYLAVERATALCYLAAVSIAEDDSDRTSSAHVAKAAVGDCQRLVAEDGLQLHGGLGFTWEQDLHFWLKRAKASELLCGSSAWHRAALVPMLGLDHSEERP